VKVGFAEIFGRKPIVAACTPGRVNLLGDHTDYNQGFVLPTIIPQQTVVEAAIGSGHHEVYSTTLARMVRFNGGELVDFARYVGGCVRVLEQRGTKVPPVQLWISSNVPVGSGLSSSAALEVATIRALAALLGLTSALKRSRSKRTARRSSTPGYRAGSWTRWPAVWGNPI